MATFPPIPPPAAPLRTGPPWEHEGPAVQRFTDTVRGVLMDPRRFFTEMRREGGLGPPLVYALIGAVIGSAATVIYQFGMIGIGGGPGTYGDAGMGLASLFWVPIFALLGLFIGSALYHVLLVALSGANYPFETTFRVVAYVLGTVYLFLLIPVCGGLIGGILAVVHSIIGLAAAQETTTGKAAGAVLIPVVVCCAAGLLFFGAAVIAAIMAGVAASR
jgi:hypothetical protein